MNLDTATLARIATATGTDLADVQAFVPVFVETAVRLVQAGETTLEALDFELVGRVASERIAHVLEQEADTILERVWEAANA